MEKNEAYTPEQIRKMEEELLALLAEDQPDQDDQNVQSKTEEKSTAESPVVDEADEWDSCDISESEAAMEEGCFVDDDGNWVPFDEYYW